MASPIIEDTGLPIREIITASNKKLNGVLQQEVFPNLFIFLRDGTRVDIDGIVRKDVKNNDLYSAILKSLEGRNSPNIDFARDSLNRFCREYSLLRENGLFGLLRTAKNRGVGFTFYEKLKDEQFKDLDAAVAIYSPHENAIKYNCALYKSSNVGPSSNYNKIQNVSAHELGHMLMATSQDNLVISLSDMLAVIQTKESNGDFMEVMRNSVKLHKDFYDFVVDSDFGRFWSMVITNDAFLSSALFDRARAEFSGTRNEEHRTGSPYYRYISVHYQNILDVDGYGEKNEWTAERCSEMFCRVLGLFGSFSSGISLLEKNHPHRLGIETLLKLAETCSISDTSAYESVKKTLENFHFSDALKHEIQNFEDLQQKQISDGSLYGTYTADEMLAFDAIQNKIYQLFADDHRAMMRQAQKIIARLPEREQMVFRALYSKQILSAHDESIKAQQQMENAQRRRHNLGR